MPSGLPDIYNSTCTGFDMLHMVIMIHGPDTCAAVHAEIGEKARSGMGKLAEASKKLQVTVQGSWVDAPAHRSYLLVDAPSAHAINELMIELQFFHWNTIEIHAVTTFEEAMSLAAS